MENAAGEVGKRGGKRWERERLQATSSLSLDRSSLQLERAKKREGGERGGLYFRDLPRTCCNDTIVFASNGYARATVKVVTEIRR